LRNNGPWGTFYRLREAVEGTGDVRSLVGGVEINSVRYKAENEGGQSTGWPIDEVK
jgi:hypothetical protein